MCLKYVQTIEVSCSKVHLTTDSDTQKNPKFNRPGGKTQFRLPDSRLKSESCTNILQTPWQYMQ